MARRFYGGAAAATAAKVVVTRALPDSTLEALRAGGCAWEGRYWSEPETAIPRSTLLSWLSPDTLGLYCLLTDKVDGEVLDRAPNLRVVSSMSVGVDHIDLAACKARGVHVGHTPGVLTDSTADLAVALTFATVRKIVPGVAAVKNGEWKTWSPFWMASPFDVSGSTVGVVGLGRIGAAFAKRMAHGFGCKILYSGSRPKPEEAEPLGATYVPLDELLQRSDIVSVHCPLTPETRGLFGKEAFARMRSSAVFINTSRGPVVDQEALYDALASNTIAAAGLDVTDPEPLPTSSPLLGLPNLVVVPHIASATYPTRMKMAMMAADNLVAGVQGKTLPFAVKL